MWTIDPTPCRGFEDRELKLSKNIDKKNANFAICDMEIQSQPLNQVHIWTVGSTPSQSFADRDLESRDDSSLDS
jgi:hypothetical protein